jgi:cell division ATPase FtsA
MRGVFILTALVSLLVIGFLVIQNMETHTRGMADGQVREVEQAREAAAQARDKIDAIRRNVNPED